MIKELSIPYAVYNFKWSNSFLAKVCYFEIIDDAVVARIFYSQRQKRERIGHIKASQIHEYRRIVFRPNLIERFEKWSVRCEWRKEKSIREQSSYYDYVQSSAEMRALLSTTFLKNTVAFDNGKVCVYRLYKFTRWPALEYFLKLGYKTLVDEILYERKNEDKTVNLYKTKLNEVLGVPHSILQKYDHPDLHERDIKVIRKMIEFGRLGQLTPERLKTISGALTYDSLDHMDIFRNFGIEKVLNYVEKQAKSRQVPQQLAWRDFQDYRRECHILGYDITDEGVMFPRDLYASHARTSKLVKHERREQPKREYEKAIKAWFEKNFNNGKYFMRVAYSAEELANEGKILHHCVGGYANRVAQKKCLIFFIRTAENPDKPLYTLETTFDTHKIIQCRGFGNAPAPAEIYQFIETIFPQKESA